MLKIINGNNRSVVCHQSVLVEAAEKVEKVPQV